ncbi:MAG: hypothetical protein AABZ10_00600 [Nitrospirota bacterium]
MEKVLADVLQECHEKKKTGALYISVIAASENLVRFYFKDGEIYHLTYGPVKDRECLDILDCYDFGRIIFFTGLKAPDAAALDLPPTPAIIASLRTKAKKVQVE